MGRTERRAAERARRKNEIRMTPERIQDLKNRTAKEAARQVGEMQKAREAERVRQALDMLILFGMTWLHKEKGYGRQRLEQYYDGVMELLKAFERDECTFTSLRDALVEETGIQLSEV